MTGKILLVIASLSLGADCLMASGVPFRMPLSATVTDRSTDGKGWREGGVMTTPLAAAQQSFKAAMLANGWRCVHAIPMDGNDRVLVLWRHGSEELTIMLWRIDVNRTGFSWGLNEKRDLSTTNAKGKVK